MADNLKPGDVVQLKSGGPQMTVIYLGTDTQGHSTAYCQWFANQDLKADTFVAAALDLLSTA
jgi:uncharacterized protein YodC (DUF2158 family)